MKKDNKKAVADRRSFLKLIGVGAVTGGAALGARAEEAEADDDANDKGGRYRETAHVRTYYDLAKF